METFEEVCFSNIAIDILPPENDRIVRVTPPNGLVDPITVLAKFPDQQDANFMVNPNPVR